METFDVVVVGLGTMGSAAACHAARRGVSVLGIDANPPTHTLGSSHGASRATRETYFEAPEYVPLAQRSFDLWRELEAETGRDLLRINGATYCGPGDHPLLAGVRRSAAEHGLSVEHLDRAAMLERFPGYRMPEGWEGIFEARAGILRADACIQAHRDLARRHGARLRYGCRAMSWRPDGSGVVIETPGGPVHAGRMILTLGPWACEALAPLGLPIYGRRIPIIHFDTARPDLYDPADMSVYFWATPEGIFAGFPHLPDEGMKIMRWDTGDVCTPDTARREVTDDDIAEVAAFADTHMPGVNGGVRQTLIGIMTMTPDNHFIIDHHPGLPGTVYATGFCGHGFKFSPVIGEVLADMALEGRTDLPVGFLGAERFQEVRAAG